MNRWWKASWLGLVALVGLPSLLTPGANRAAAADLKAGDEVVTVSDNIDFGYRESTVAELKRGAKMLVTDVRDPWIGGQITVDGEIKKGWLHKHEVRRAAIEHKDLPEAKDEASALALLERWNVTVEKDDEGHVQVINAVDSGLTDAALDALQHFPKLYELQLSGTAVTNAGLQKLAEIKTLEMLDLSRTEVTDEGLAAIANLENLVLLLLERSRVTGQGAAKLATLSDLRTINLSYCAVTDKDLELLGQMKNLEVVTLSHTQLEGPGLKFLQPLPKLRVLNISHTKVTEDELMNLQNAPILKMLYVRGLKISDGKVNELKDTLVSCAIYRW